MATSSSGSSKSVVTIIVLLVVGLILCCLCSGGVAGIVYYVSRDTDVNTTDEKDETTKKTTSKDEDTTKKSTEKTTSVEQKSYIEGSLGYPGEGIPNDLQVCAEDVSTMQTTCTDEQIESSKYTYGKGYKLEVVPGTYYVYTFRTSDPMVYGIYSEYVTCGMAYGCESHEYVTVTVTAGQTKSGIDPIDWYYEP